MGRGQDFQDDPGRQVRSRMMTLLTQALSAPSRLADGTVMPLPLRLVTVFVQATDASGGSITLAPTELHRMTLCSTDDTAARLENLQEVIGHGPVHDAAASSAAVTADLAGSAAADQWPALASTVTHELGAVRLCAFPMRTGSETIGVITVHRRADGGGSSDDWSPPLEEAGVLADMIGAAIASAGIDADTGVPWDVRDRISQATGMVIGQLGVSPTDAIALIRASAFSSDLDLGDFAAEILDHRRDFSTDHRGKDRS